MVIMCENILLISDAAKDEEALKGLLNADQYRITRIPFNGKVEKALSDEGIPLIMADYDLIREKAHFFYSLQQGKSKACVIFYGQDVGSEELGTMLQQGIYAYIPRRFLKERVRDAVLGGLENRRAFIAILGMMESLKELNSSLESEKESLKKKNQELRFINRLSREISYDVGWDTILTRMISAGLDRALNYRLFGLLFKIGANWKLSLHMAGLSDFRERENFVKEILAKVNQKFNQAISEADTDFEFIPMNRHDSFGCNNMEIIPLILAGKILGFVIYEAGDSKGVKDETDVLINTLSNMLSLSLKNAQEYYRLKEASMTDALTGVYNRKGLFDFLEKELPRADRYKKSASLILADMDDFKGINDTMGHQAGDYVLMEYASILKKSFRRPDIVARFGGDEFAILLPETGLESAHAIMQRVIETLDQHTFEWGLNKFRVNISYGVSNSDELINHNDQDALIGLSDARLYEHKTHRSKRASGY